MSQIPEGCIAISHPKHGDAHCHPDQLPGFKAAGWTTEKPKKPEKTEK